MLHVGMIAGSVRSLTVSQELRDGPLVLLHLLDLVRSGPGVHQSEVLGSHLILLNRGSLLHLICDGFFLGDLRANKLPWVVVAHRARPSPSWQSG